MGKRIDTSVTRRFFYATLRNIGFKFPRKFGRIFEIYFNFLRLKNFQLNWSNLFFHNFNENIYWEVFSLKLTQPFEMHSGEQLTEFPL